MELDLVAIEHRMLCDADVPVSASTSVTLGEVWREVDALALVAEVRRLRAIEDAARAIHARYDQSTFDALGAALEARPWLTAPPHRSGRPTGAESVESGVKT